MNDDLVSKAIDAYENEPGVMQFPAMYAAGKVFESFYKAEIELLRTEAKGLSQSLTDCLECEKDYLSEIAELRAEVEALRSGQKLLGYRWRHSANEKWQFSDIPCGWEYEPVYAAMKEQAE